jgi:Ca2+-binding RTX toxin-like protein
MSYNRPSQNGLPGKFGNQAVWGNLSASTPMVYDVAAIQAIYGADTNTRTGADVYGFGASFTGGFASQADPFRFSASHGGVFTIYDAGGRDRLDGSVFTSDQVIDLNPGAYSSMGRDGGNSGALLTFNVGIAFNTIVEDASGGSGNDQITGNDADNQLNGNDGNDTLSGGLGTNKLYGGFGNDTYILGDGADTIVDPSGYDTVRFTNASTINFQDGFGLGDPSNDVWNESFIDRIEGSNGDDVIILTIGGTGTQDIAGNGGNDILGGNAEFNKMYGGNGNDYLYGRDGWDTMEGGSGNDELNGDAGNDYMTGGTGNDAINGGSGDFDTADFSDHIGNASLGWTFELVNRTAVTSYTVGVILFVDETDTFSGIENLVGSSGNDFFYGHFGTYLNGGDGTDTLTLEATTPFLNFQFAADDRVDLEQGFSERDSLVFAQPPERQSFGNIEIIHTNVGNDTVVGSTRNDIVYGDEGNDTISGAAGDDTIIGGAGGDTLDGGIDNDTLSYQSSVTAVAINLLANTAAGGDATGDLISGFENVFGSTGSDRLTGNILANRLDGDTGNDTLNGGAGADTLNGGIGSDTLIGGIGGDRLDGGIGIDTLSYADSSLGVTVNLLTNTASGGDAAGDIISGFERLIGSNGADKLTGNTLGNVLTGGLGRDILTGGLGKDAFDFNAITESTLGATTRDLIVDFNEAATDRIDLSTIDADALLAGNNIFSFIGAAAFTGLGQARVFQYGGSTYVDINSIGSIAADMRIQLTGLHSLDAADFIL